MQTKFAKGKYRCGHSRHIHQASLTSRFAAVPERPDFPEEEETVLAYWKEIDAFREQTRRSEGRKAYTFYDGPPFATGLPHYGHIAAGTIKVSATPFF
jgi:isoleucyl-tRNA synthetase